LLDKYSVIIGQMQYLNIMTREEKILLKKNLPKKWANELSKRTGFSKDYVHKVMCGDRFQIDIEESALTLAKEYTERLSLISELKDKLL
jgi:hypothetical protein